MFVEDMVKLLVLLSFCMEMILAFQPSIYKETNIPYNNLCPLEVNSDIRSDIECSAHCHIKLWETSCCFAYIYNKTNGICNCGTSPCFDPSNVTGNYLDSVYSTCGKQQQYFLQIRYTHNFCKFPKIMEILFLL